MVKQGEELVDYLIKYPEAKTDAEIKEARRADTQMESCRREKTNDFSRAKSMGQSRNWGMEELTDELKATGSGQEGVLHSHLTHIL